MCNTQDMRAADAALAQQQKSQQGSMPPTIAPPLPLSVEVHPLPLRMCVLSKTSFVLPAQGAAARSARCDSRVFHSGC